MTLVVQPIPPVPSRYRSLKLLGRGGFSAVYLARDEGLNRVVALKVMRGRYETSAWARSRLLFEAEVTAGLEHPGVVPVYSRGDDDRGLAYFTMRYIQGETLEDALKGLHQAVAASERTRLLRRLVDRLVDVCYTAAFAHEKGIIHRDLTPCNIMLGRHGETLVVVWGLARSLGQAGPDVGASAAETAGWPASARGLTGTRAGESVGTPRYMSPEQALGCWDQLGPATDVFGLGATLYHVLTGRPPFDDRDDRASTERARRGDCLAPRRLDRRIPAALETVCLKAMLRDPRDRYASTIALGDDLARWIAAEPLSVPRRSTLRAWDRQTTPK